jgi:hypothetical protein
MRILRSPWGHGPVPAAAEAFLVNLVAPWRCLGSALQDAEGMAPLPTDPPIGGPVWTVLIPAILLVGSFIGTYLLYRRFARE